MTRPAGDAPTGADMHRWATELWPLHRSLTGAGLRQTLDHLGTLLPGLVQVDVPSGTEVLDWRVPDEWTVRGAWIADLEGRRLVDLRDSTLHLMGYSIPFEGILTREELEPHLHSLPEQPDAIPYVTSYYARRWGFCLTQRQRDALGDGPFQVVVDTDLEPGALTYGEVVLPGETDDEVLLSTYVCHPSMANNELSGPVVTTALLRWLTSLPSRRFTYRAVFLPETIGSITYLARHLDHLKRHVRAGWVLTCIGDDRTYSYIPSRLGGTLADRISLRALGELPGGFTPYTFLDRGSDERQWCSPGADLPVCSITRSKYDEYPEYHTSLDDLELVTPSGLQGGFDVMRRCLELLETGERWRVVTPGEPQLGRRGLYPTTSDASTFEQVMLMMNVLTYCDGDHDLTDLCERTGATAAEVGAILDRLAAAEVIALS